MRATWLDARSEPWWRRLLLLPLVPVSWVYAAVAGLHRGASERGWLRRRRLAGHVVSVGNLVVGGTAKTPVSAWLARGLSRRGRKVALASRGYGRSGREAVSVVSDGRFVRGRAEESGDEPMVLAAQAAGVPVLVGRDRGVVGLRALAAFGAEVLVLDDGFQHHRLARDVDLVLFDGALGFGNGYALPRGPLREPASALRRADAVLVIDGPLPPEDEDRLRSLAPTARRFDARRRPSGLRPLAGGEAAPADALSGLVVGLLAGLARPASFRRSVEALGATVVAERFFPDHHRYRPRDLAGLADVTPMWITTEKDAVKLVPQWTGRADVRVLTLAVEVEEPERMLDWIESRLR
ncbi:MAG: tetraacyldisaccharide 4'-kinase [Myxococcota bacterium]